MTMSDVAMFVPPPITWQSARNRENSLLTAQSETVSNYFGAVIWSD